MTKPTPPTSDEPLDLGEVEAGEHPGARAVAEGAHPWSPTEIAAYSQPTIPYDAVAAALPAITWGTAEGDFVDWPTTDDAQPVALALLDALGFRVTGITGDG